MMSASRWLLPFTYGVDLQAIEQTVRLAASCDAVLYPVALISLSQHQPAQQVRLEQCMQANDFCEVVRHKAAQYAVTVQCQQVITHDPVPSINRLAQEWCCTGIVVVIKQQQAVLLEANELRQLLLQPAVSLVLIRLPKKQHSLRMFHLRIHEWLSSWLLHCWKPWKKDHRGVARE